MGPSVLVFVSTMQLSGTERNLVSMLPRLTAAGADITVCTMTTRFDSAIAAKLPAAQIERIDLDARRLLDPAALRRFLNLVGSSRFDLVHAQDQYSSVYTWIARRVLGVPSVMSRHTLRDPADTAREKVRARAGIMAVRYGADMVLCVSDAVRRELSDRARVPPRRLRTVYNGIDVTEFEVADGARQAKRRELGWPEHQPVVIMVAVLRRGKGHEVLMKAAPAVLRAHPDTRFALVGDGELAESLKREAGGLGTSVEFLGQRVDVPELLAAADVLVLPSWSEALPGVLLEAGAAGLPVVTTDAGGAPEIVVNGETGFVVARGDDEALGERIAGVLSNPDGARSLGRRANEHVRSLFSLEAQAWNTLSLYNDVLASRRAPSL